MLSSNQASADEGGVSFWIPGLFGSLAATPQQPGWSLANIYYHNPSPRGPTSRVRANLRSTGFRATELSTPI
jgi:hypothetical protein